MTKPAVASLLAEFPYRGALGRRLLVFGAGLILLVLLSGSVALFAWQGLGRALHHIVEESVPTIRESAVLEQQGSHLQGLAHQIAQADSLAEIAVAQQQIVQPLARAADAASRLSTWYPREAPTLHDEIELTRAAVEALAESSQRQRNAASTLKMLRLRLEWIHADLADELQLLLEERMPRVERNVNFQASGETRTERAVRDRALLSLLSAEQRLANSLIALSRPRSEPLADSSLAQLSTEGSRIRTLAGSLPPDKLVSLGPLLAGLVELIRPHGELDSAIAQYVQAHAQVQSRLDSLEALIVRQNQRVNRINEQSRDTTQAQFERFVRIANHGHWLIAGATVASIVLMVWLVFGLVGRKLIGRLALVGQNIEAISRGQYTLPRTIGGRDEIGRLGEQLSRLANDMAELERTNALALIAHTDAALVICDTAGTIRSINRAARDLRPELAVGETLAGLLGDDAFSRLLRLENSEDTLDLVLPFGEAGSEQYLRLRARAFRQNEELARMVTLFDISAQMRSAHWLERMVETKTAALDETNLALRHEIDERKRAQDGLVQATKFAVLGQTMTSLAHELNQPLAALTNYHYLARIAIERRDDPVSLAATLHQGDRVLERMTRLVRSYRNVGRRAPQTPALATLDLGPIVSDVLELLHGRIAKENVQVKEATGPWPRIVGEVVRLEQVILNLVGNALDAVRCRCDARIELWHSTDRTRAELCIADNGPGLDAIAIENLFLPFFTTKQDGLGLGLSISRSLAEECRAEIRLASRLGGGALVVLSLELEHGQ